MSSTQLSGLPVAAYIQTTFGGSIEPAPIVYPKLPRRTVWNPKYPQLHTIKSAVIYVVQESTDNGLAISPPQVNKRLIEMGFEPQLVVRTIQAILSSTPGINKCLVRFYPNDSSKSWACYAFGWGANVIDKKHKQLAGWLNTNDHFTQTVQVIRTMAKIGRDHFTTQMIST